MVLSVGEGEAPAWRSWEHPVRLGWGYQGTEGLPGWRVREALPGAEASEPGCLASAPLMVHLLWVHPGPQQSEGRTRHLAHRFTPPYK